MGLGLGPLRLSLVTLCVLSCVSGCGFSNPKPPSGQLEIEKVANWFHRYRRLHRGKAPKDESQFIEFIEVEFEKLGGEVDAVEMITSPRDGKTYEMQYGVKVTSKNPEEVVACYEREGYAGKKLVAYETGISKEVDEAELQSLLGE